MLQVLGYRGPALLGLAVAIGGIATLTAPTAQAATAVCGNLASDYQGVNAFTEELGQGSSNPAFALTATSALDGTAVQTSSGTTLSGAYHVIPTTVFSGKSAHGMVVISMPFAQNAYAYDLVGTPICGAQGEVREISGPQFFHSAGATSSVFLLDR
jgi:hypothetical protein